ncbi:MAG TPA: OmpA family protein [Gemmatimonadales bacterium]|jgi:peptidoglycan-associated lipoprotein|nr:OmpA family protein [Gemmatimonadales bacterium]
MRKNVFLMGLMSAALVAACHSNPPADQPAPQPTEAEIARQRQVQDSLDAVARASAEAARVARARADSVERVRVAAANAAREAAERVARKTAELRTELAVAVHFDVARAQLQEDDREALDRKVAILKANPGVRLRITGATDDRGSDKYNLALGDRRAAAVRKYLIDKGIDVARLDVASSGEGSPVDSGKDEAAWAQNRRAEFVIVSADSPLALN